MITLLAPTSTDRVGGQHCPVQHATRRWRPEHPMRPGASGLIAAAMWRPARSGFPEPRSSPLPTWSGEVAGGDDGLRREFASMRRGRSVVGYARELAEAYLGALGRADLTAILSLFGAGAVVHSPLYGPVPACEFFPALFGDTAESRLTLRGVTQGTAADGTPLVSIWFHFDWQLPGGQRAPSTWSMCWNLTTAATSRPCVLSTTPRTSGPSSSRKPVGAPGGQSSPPANEARDRVRGRRSELPA